MSNCIDDLTSAEFCVRGILPDNHALNVHAFSSLTAIFNFDSHQYINHSRNFGKKTYLFYDTVHIMKNISNNLLNGKKFVFPEFIYNDGLNIDINFPAGFIQWKDLHNIYDKGLSANLNKAPKLSYQALHPGRYTSNVLGNVIISVTKRRTFTEYLLTGSSVGLHHHLLN